MTLFNFFSTHPAAFTAGCFIFGLLVGSFLNVVIYRLPKMMERDWKHECRLILDIEDHEAKNITEKFNLAFPNSSCPHCGTAIKPWQNIPVISYLILGGKCHHCKASISIRYPLIELATGIIAAVIAWKFGVSLQTLALLGFSFSLIALTMIDIDHQLLPDQITLPLMWTGLIANQWSLFCSPVDAFWGAVAGYMSLWCVFQLFKLVTGKEGMGFGDFKLLAALGAWMGWQQLPLIIILSSLVGAVLGSIMLSLAKKGRGTPIPFGPYLAIAGWIAMLWGTQITDMYFQFAGLK
jgi:leader peptidase (prepilin peptidase)/N-methyltransferase